MPKMEIGHNFLLVFLAYRLLSPDVLLACAEPLSYMARMPRRQRSSNQRWVGGCRPKAKYCPFSGHTGPKGSWRSHFLFSRGPASGLTEPATVTVFVIDRQ